MNRGGFTLVSLVVALAIIALIYTIAVPGLSSLMPKARLDGVARLIATELQRARFRSIAEGVDVRVTFDTAARTYRLCGETLAGSNTFTNCEGIKSIDDANAIAIAATATTTTFNARGGCEQPTVLTLTARGGEVRRVGARASGQVYVQ